MATAAYRKWVNAGRPFRLATPIKELVAWAKANGIPILGTIGNEEHLQKSMPQDHTPFSFTPWPVPLDGYVVTAIDLANVRGLGQLIEDGARAGRYPWLKYMNHSGQHLDSRDLDGDGKTFEETPSDDEHVHVSIRTDWQNRSIGTFDPFGTTQGDDDMTPYEHALLEDAAFRLDAEAVGSEVIRGGQTKGQPYAAQVQRNRIERKFDAFVGAEETRDAAVLAAIQALAGNGGPDAAPIVAAIKAESEKTRAEVIERLETVHAEEMAELRRAFDAEKAGLQAELDRLNAG